MLALGARAPSRSWMRGECTEDSQKTGVARKADRPPVGVPQPDEARRKDQHRGQTKTLTTRNSRVSVEIGPICSELEAMRLSNLADYAIVIMAATARKCGGGRVSAADLAQETGIPVPTAQKIVSKLSAAGLLRSTRGAGGGLQLARPAAAISMADIVEAIEGPIALVSCIDTGDCAVEHECSVKPHWPVVNAAVRGALADVSLASLATTQTLSQKEMA